MTIERSAFYSDRLFLTWTDLLRLALGRVLEVSGMCVQRAKPTGKADSPFPDQW